MKSNATENNLRERVISRIIVKISTTINGRSKTFRAWKRSKLKSKLKKKCKIMKNG